MFTGIVQDVGVVRELESREGDLRLTVQATQLPLSRVAIGDSIAVSGTCLTAVSIDRAARTFCADVSRETLANTTIGHWRVGRAVNLEPALRAGDPLGGHLVSGHVDGVAQLLARREQARSQQLRIAVPVLLARYVARKGSVTLDGVSLTVNEVQGSEFEVNLVPHTLAVTTLAQLAIGDPINLEVDPIARYVERLVIEYGKRD